VGNPEKFTVARQTGLLSTEKSVCMKDHKKHRAETIVHLPVTILV
jgi:hypothetical protein